VAGSTREAWRSHSAWGKYGRRFSTWNHSSTSMVSMNDGVAMAVCSIGQISSQTHTPGARHKRRVQELGAQVYSERNPGGLRNAGSSDGGRLWGKNEDLLHGTGTESLKSKGRNADRAHGKELQQYMHTGGEQGITQITGEV
jgi:hypothetical protein